MKSVKEAREDGRILPANAQKHGSIYLLGGRQGLESGRLGHDRVAVARAGVQGQGQAGDGADAHLRDGDLVVRDGERRLSQHRVHGQRGLHLRRQERGFVLYCPST